MVYRTEYLSDVIAVVLMIAWKADATAVWKVAMTVAMMAVWLAA